MPDKEDLCDEAVDLFADDKFDEAIELYKQALEVDPKFGDAAQGLALCYKAKGDLDTAIEVTNSTSSMSPRTSSRSPT